MANDAHVKLLKEGPEAWNAARAQDREFWRQLKLKPDRQSTDADPPETCFIGLATPRLVGANLAGLDLRGVNFQSANLAFANLADTNLQGADLRGADLRAAHLLKTDLRNAILIDCDIWGIAAWGVQLEGAEQGNLRIQHGTDPVITVDDLEVAQFIYLLLSNPKIRNAISTIGKRAVLLLGRFTADRKPILEAMRGELRRLGYLPIVFDFERSTERDFTETVLVLAGLSLFVIADITNPKSSSLELQATVPNYMIPFVPILQEGAAPFAMFSDLQHKYDWVLDILTSTSLERLVSGFEHDVIGPALKKHDELVTRKTAPLRVRRIADAP